MGRMVTAVAEQIAPWNLQDTHRDDWLELRRDGLGGSDMPAVAGMNTTGRRQRVTRWDVWISKVAPELDRPEPADDSRMAELVWFGHQMEAVAARRFKMRHPGVKVSRCGMLARRDIPWMRVNVDYLASGCREGKCLLEVKNRAAWVAADWDTDGDIEKIPDDVVIQATWGLIVAGGPPCGYTHAHVLVVIGGNELREYLVPWDQKLADTITGEGDWFWNAHVLPRVPPPVDAAERTGMVLARLWDADPDTIMIAPARLTDLVERLHAAEALAGETADSVALLRHALMAEMGEHEVLLDSTGRKLATWRQNSTFRDKEFRAAEPALAKQYTVPKDVTDTKALAADHPDLYRQYRARQLRLAPPPKD
jgi:putative phage-type endonuclease